MTRPTLYVLPDTSEWRDHAVCADPHIPTQAFYADKPGTTRRNKHTAAVYAAARAICATCPVTTQCLATAMVNSETEGLWGGKSPRQRQRLRRSAIIDYPCRLCTNRIRHDTNTRRSWYCYECRRRQNQRQMRRWRQTAS